MPNGYSAGWMTASPAGWPTVRLFYHGKMRANIGWLNID